MIFNLNKLYKKTELNNEIIFLIFLIFVSIISTQFYNNQKKIVKENYKSVINNIYFQNSTKHFFNNLSPRYVNIEHKISNGETFNKILKE